MKIIFLGGQIVGQIAYNILRDNGIKPILAVCYDSPMYARCVTEVTTCQTIKDKLFTKTVKTADLLFSVHGREIIPAKILKKVKGINLHPYYYCYKGKDPIKRAIEEDNQLASVGAHWMKPEVDSGDVIKEIRFQLSSEYMTSVVNVYSQLYPIYADVIRDLICEGYFTDPRDFDICTGDDDEAL